MAIYRDGSKRSQPLNTTKSNGVDASCRRGQGSRRAESAHPRTRKRDQGTARTLGGTCAARLPDTRTAITHKFDIAGHEGYLTVGLFEDGTPGELFITMAKEGSTIGGLMDTIGTLASLALQYGVPLETLVNKFAHQRFEPSGFTKNPDIRDGQVDHRLRVPLAGLPVHPRLPRGQLRRTLVSAELPLKEVAEQEKQAVNRPVQELAQTGEVPARPVPKNGGGLTVVQQLSRTVEHFMQDAPDCDICGAITVRNGACYKCLNCGNSMGCS